MNLEARWGQIWLVMRHRFWDSVWVQWSIDRSLHNGNGNHDWVL